MEFIAKSIRACAQHRTGCLVIGVPEGARELAGDALAINEATDGLVRAIVEQGDMEAKPGNTLLLHRPQGITAERLLLVGLGKAEELDARQFRKLIQKAATSLKALGAKDATIAFSGIEVIGRDNHWQASQWAQAITDACYAYDETKSKKQPELKLKKILLASRQAAETQKALDLGKAIGLGQNATKHLGNLPANICTPQYLATQAKLLADKQKHLSVDVLEEKELRKLNMGSFLSVAAGSEQPPRLIVLHYKGGDKNAAPHVLVGKGVTFDTGGISLKPGAGMDEMKFDMCGAASVLGVFTALAELLPAINVVGIVPATENMPSGRATKPGDVVTSMSGQTIEILNTDAEGRLILCDALTYAERFKPASVVDIATLTGACVVALGKHATGLFANNDLLAEQLLAAGEATGDRAWRLPLWEDYQEQLDSNFADMANIGGPQAGPVTAACFLSRFTKSYPWAHLDIAGTAWNSGGTAKGATGRPVPLLMRYLLDRAGQQ